MKIAVLGTGTMGGPIARNLAKAKHKVRVWNRTRERAQRLGAEVFDNPVDAVAGAEAVITMLSDGPAVEKVAQKALQLMEPGGLWLQMSTVGVASGERLAALGEDYELVFVDAPVLGSKESAEKGKGSFFLAWVLCYMTQSTLSTPRIAFVPVAQKVAAAVRQARAG